MKDIVVKNIQYSFEEDSIYQYAKEFAVKSVKDRYLDEKNLEEEEYQLELADGNVTDFKDYQENILGYITGDIDYSKSFEGNLSHPIIQRDIEETTNKYMCNIKDLPKNAVIKIDENDFEKEGKPSRYAVCNALKEKFGVAVKDYSYAGEAEKKDLLSQNAYEKVGEMLNSQNYKSYLELRASIGKYSSNNISLIYLQKADSQAVMGFNAWKKLDRHVDKGSTGIYIWQPVQRIMKTEKSVDSYLQKYPNLYGKPDSQEYINAKEKFMDEIDLKGVAKVNDGFRLGTVFDVSQTVSNDAEHDNIEEILHLDKPLNKDMENYEEIVSGMKDAAELSILNIPKDGSQQDNLYNAVYNYADKVFSECPEKINGIRSNLPSQKDMHKIETAMSAYLICKHVGIECEDKAVLKITETLDKSGITEEMLMKGKRGMFLEAFDRSCKLTDMFNKSFDKSLGIDYEAQLEAKRQELETEKSTKEQALKDKADNTVVYKNKELTKVDEWEKDGKIYQIGKSEEKGGYAAVVKMPLGNHGSMLKPIKSYGAKPDRSDVEFDEQKMSSKELKKSTSSLGKD